MYSWEGPDTDGETSWRVFRRIGPDVSADPTKNWPDVRAWQGIRCFGDRAARRHVSLAGPTGRPPAQTACGGAMGEITQASV